jgi:hypothetical protein
MRGRYKGGEGAKGRRRRILRGKEWRWRRELYGKALFNDCYGPL